MRLSDKALAHAETQARVCEIQGRWAWAAILWRRAGDMQAAYRCENILAATAGNPRLTLITQSYPTVIRPHPSLR